MSSKIDRALYGPSWTEVIIGALLSVSIGATLAGVWLVMKPVEKVREIPEEPVSGMVYFIEGSRNGSIGAAWQRKSQLFVSGRSVSLNEQELNEAARQLGSEGKKKDKAAKDALMTPGKLNFRISDGELQIALPLDLNVYGFKAKLQVVSRGGFERSGDHFVYVPNSIYVGSCPIERIPQIGGILLGKIWEAMSQQDEIATAWNSLANVTVEGRNLKLVAR